MMPPSDVPRQDKASRRKRDTGKRRESLSLYPLSLETALGAAIATGPIPVEDRKPKPKKKAPIAKPRSNL